MPRHRLELTGCESGGTGFPVPPARNRVRRGQLGVLLAVLTLAALMPQVASGHAIVRPAASRPADLQLYTVIVPTETDAATKEVALKVPAEIDFLLVKETPGWKVAVERRNDRIDVIRWTGSAGPDLFAEFRIIARNPILEGDLPWRITQIYANGETVRWIGPPESDFPASVTRLSEAAEPVDVATGLNGGGGAPSGGEASDGEGVVNTTDGSGDSSDSVARVGAGAAIVLGLGALAATLVGRRRPRKTT